MAIPRRNHWVRQIAPLVVATHFFAGGLFYQLPSPLALFWAAIGYALGMTFTPFIVFLAARRWRLSMGTVLASTATVAAALALVRALEPNGFIFICASGNILVFSILSLGAVLGVLLLVQELRSGGVLHGNRLPDQLDPSIYAEEVHE